MTFKTTEAYVSGAICGTMWMPAATGGVPFRQSLIGYGGFDSAEQLSFRDVLLSMLTRNGGDFQDSRFSADTLVVIVRKAFDGNGKYRVHVREREVSTLRDCADLVHGDVFVSDFLNDE
jgi:hypothetical protein